MTKLEELDQQIAELKKQKEIEELKIEIEKIKKTKIEEITVIRRNVYQDYPWYPWYLWSSCGPVCTRTNSNPMG